ncbi:MAG: hypothetical protein ACFHX7_19900 [Pseudomonadota bacterium]
MLQQLVLVIVTLCVAGCEVQPTRPTKPDPVTPPLQQPPDADPEPDERELQINRLLGKAYLAYVESRLTTPVEDNAYLHYVHVLALDPGNEEALQGLSQIVEKYLEWAITNVDRGNFSVATDYLNKASSIDEFHPNIPAVRNLIQDQQSRDRRIISLSTSGLSTRDSALAAELQQIGKFAASHQATVIIRARNDAEGRWIYQQLNSEAEARVRARLELGSNPRLRLLY